MRSGVNGRRSMFAASAVAAFAAASIVACGDSPAGPSDVAGGTGAAVTAGAPVSAGGGPEYANVMAQGGGSVYAPNGAMLVRQPTGLRLSITMPTPEPGSYVYAPGRMEVGNPEVFTLWAFVFNYPQNCTPPGCDGDDLGANTAAKGGVYNVAGHPSGGGGLTLSGRLAVGQSPFAPNTAPLESPQTAEIHLAVAPHGALDPDRLPDDFRLPTGSPACGCWWVAIFD